MEKEKKEIGDIWKEGKEWKVQLPKGRWTTKTKKAAKEISRVITNPLAGTME